MLLVYLSAVKSISSCEKNALKNYDVNIFPARFGWLKHFPASAQLKFGSASAQTFYG